MHRIMGDRLYVGDPSFNTSREDLAGASASAREIREDTIPTDREAGQARGFAFVTTGPRHETPE
jgi:cold-inducible RNA-binding protein